MTTSTDTREVLALNIGEAVRDTMRFAIVENSLLLTVSPISVREREDGRWEVIGVFCEGEDLHEIHTRRIVGAFNEVEIVDHAWQH